MPASASPRHQVRHAPVGDRRAVPFGGVGGPDLAALLADHLDRQPAAIALDVTDAQVDGSHSIGSIQRELDIGIHPAGRVQLADPVELGLDTERLERAEEDLAHEMAGVVGRAAAFRGRDAAQRCAHVALDGVGGQQRLRVHGVHVVHAVEKGGIDAGLPQRPIDRIVEDDPSQAADVDRARRRLRIVDDLAPRNRCC